MTRLANRSVAPPGSFRYFSADLAKKHPELGWFGPFHAFGDLMAEISKRCRANGVTIPSEPEVEEWLCNSLPYGHCVDSLGMLTGGNFTNMAITLAEVTEGTSVFASWVMHGFKRVSPAESTRRAQICVSCPYHRPIVGCQGCAGGTLRGLINRIVANTALPVDAMVQGCGVCRCSLVAKIRVPVEDILPHMPEDRKSKLWENCWITNPVPN